MNDRGHGWIIFAAIVLGVAGIMRIFDAIWAFRYHGAVPQKLEEHVSSVRASRPTAGSTSLWASS